MKQIELGHETISFQDIENIPEIDVQFGACRSYPDGHFFDIIDFKKKGIERWSVPHLDVSRAEKQIRAKVKPENFPGSADFFVKEMLSTHVLQVSPKGKLFVNRGNFLNGTSFYMIDTEKSEAFVMMEEDDEEPMFYTCTGGFDSNYSRWYFVRWPLSDSAAIMNGETDVARCEIGAVELETGNVEIFHTLENDDRIHQITVSPDDRYLVFTSFKSDMRVRYPRVAMAEDPEGYRRSHEAGIIPKSVVTLDMQTKEHWVTEVPFPVSAHMEFDLHDPTVFYVSGHNFSISYKPEVIIEGDGAIIKMQIQDGTTPVIGQYAPGDLFRVSQHVPFSYNGKTIITVTNTPNKLDLVDGEMMTLWRREELFPYPPLDFSLTGSSVSPMPSQAFFSINPSSDGKYIVLETSEKFHFYDVEAGNFLEATMQRFLPDGAGGTGHTRIVGR